jgi:methyl-accepting chemotaxis protein
MTQNDVSAQGRVSRTSLAMRMRGWVEASPTEEQRLKDRETARLSVVRRWVLIGATALLLLSGKVVGAVAASLIPLLAVVVLAAAANAGLEGLLRSGWYRWWGIYALAGLDVALAVALVAFFGPGAMIAALFVAIVPYTLDQGRGVGESLLLAGSLAYLVAAALHGWLFTGRDPFALSPSVYLEALLFIGAAWMVTQLSAALIRRIRVTRGVMAEAEAGNLGVRAPAEHLDELGFLEQSLNRMLDETATTISQVQREADEVAAFAELLATHASEMLNSGRGVADTASQLAQAMQEQHELAASGRSDGTSAAEEARELYSRAELMQVDARELVDAATRGRDSVLRAGEALLSVGTEVRATATTVDGLRSLSEGIGAFADTISKIARRTRLLALNAAIEAARAEEHGEGFAAVADQVRALAGEAAESAREATHVISEIQSGIAAVATAMSTGESHVRDVGDVADEARAALDAIQQGAVKAADLVTATTQSSQAQATRMSGLAERLSRVADISSAASSGASSTARAMAAQIAAMESLTQTGQQLADLAERLQASIARFTVMRPEFTTKEHEAVRRPSGAHEA